MPASNLIDPLTGQIYPQYGGGGGLNSCIKNITYVDDMLYFIFYIFICDNSDPYASLSCIILVIFATRAFHQFNVSAEKTSGL